MLCLYVTCKVKKGDTQNFLDAAQDMVAGTRKEPGCIFYGVGAVDGQADTCAFVEVWRDEAALDAHGQYDHFKQGIAAIRPFQEEPMQVERINVD